MSPHRSAASLAGTTVVSTNASGLAFNHIDFATNSGTAINVQSATNISFDSVTDHGTVAGTGNGMIIRDSSGVSFTKTPAYWRVAGVVFVHVHVLFVQVLFL